MSHSSTSGAVLRPFPEAEILINGGSTMSSSLADWAIGLKDAASRGIDRPIGPEESAQGWTSDNQRRCSSSSLGGAQTFRTPEICVPGISSALHVGFLMRRLDVPWRLIPVTRGKTWCSRSTTPSPERLDRKAANTHVESVRADRSTQRAALAPENA